MTKAAKAARYVDDPHEPFTIGQLRARIKDLPDDAPICVKLSNGEEWQKQWRYQTRHVDNAYRANDDRFTQNQVLTIEVGDYQP